MSQKITFFSPKLAITYMMTKMDGFSSFISFYIDCMKNITHYILIFNGTKLMFLCGHYVHFHKGIIKFTIFENIIQVPISDNTSYTIKKSKKSNAKSNNLEALGVIIGKIMRFLY